MRGELFLYGELISNCTIRDAVQYVVMREKYSAKQREQVQWDFQQGNEHRGYRFKVLKNVTRHYVKPVDMSMEDWNNFVRATDNLFEVYKQDRSLR